MIVNFVEDHFEKANGKDSNRMFNKSKEALCKECHDHKQKTQIKIKASQLFKVFPIVLMTDKLI